VEEVVDLRVEVLDPQGRLRQVAVNRDDSILGPEAARVYPRGRGGALS
jgi:hypothetical protein